MGLSDYVSIEMLIYYAVFGTIILLIMWLIKVMSVNSENTVLVGSEKKPVPSNPYTDLPVWQPIVSYVASILVCAFVKRATKPFEIE